MNNTGIFFSWVGWHFYFFMRWLKIQKLLWGRKTKIAFGFAGIHFSSKRSIFLYPPPSPPKFILTIIGLTKAAGILDISKRSCLSGYHSLTLLLAGDMKQALHADTTNSSIRWYPTVHASAMHHNIQQVAGWLAGHSVVEPAHSCLIHPMLIWRQWTSMCPVHTKPRQDCRILICRFKHIENIKMIKLNYHFFLNYMLGYLISLSKINNNDLEIESYFWFWGICIA